MTSNERRFNSFGLSDKVMRGIKVMGYTKPMPVQVDVIDKVKAEKDLIVQSQTGSGKTSAFGIPIVDEIDVDNSNPQVLVLTPTRELAVQVCEELADIGKYKKIRCLPIYGKQPIHIQLRQLKQRVHAAVGTPGRTLDLIKRKNLILDDVRYLVIDEADELLKRGFIDEVEAIIQKVPSERVTLLFSATMPKEIEHICRQYMIDPERIEVNNEQIPMDQINQSYLEVANDWKFARLKEILEAYQPFSCMVFCNTKAKVDHLHEKLKVGRFKCASLHGGMAQKYRLQAINAFKQGQVQILVATDLAARGIHVDRLDLVINYNVPNEEENYVHRIGRTGRAGHSGEAITFVNGQDKKKWQEVQTFIDYKVPVFKQGKSMKRFEENSDDLIKVEPAKFKPKKITKKHKDITRLRINVGKKKKVRPGDILGALSNLPSLNSDDIGIIDIQDTCSYIEIHHDKGEIAAMELVQAKVKGKNVSVKVLKR